MKMNDYLKIGGMAVGALAALNSFYVIGETEQAVLTRFGKPTKIMIGSIEPGKPDNGRVERLKLWNSKQSDPVGEIVSSGGLHFKIPIFDTVHKFDNRILEYDSAPENITTKDKKHLTVDNYARWSIENPLLYMRSVKTLNGAVAALDDIIYATVREGIGGNRLIETVRTGNEPIAPVEGETLEEIYLGKDKILKDITDISGKKASQYGISIHDVRIKRADLPPENANSIYQRMIAERKNIATKYRSEGSEEAQKITASADKEKTMILASAYEAAQGIKGKGEAEATSIYAQGYGQDPKFFEFMTTLESYKAAFEKGNTKLIMPLDTGYNRFILGEK